jgi:hypothetical protein
MASPRFVPGFQRKSATGVSTALTEAAPLLPARQAYAGQATTMRDHGPFASNTTLTTHDHAIVDRSNGDRRGHIGRKGEHPDRIPLPPRPGNKPSWLGSSGGANGNGATPEEAVADLREAVQMVIDEDGIPEQLAQTLDLEVV